MGNYERMSAQRALPDRHGHRGRARRPARRRARTRSRRSSRRSRSCAIEGTVRALWSTREMPQREAVRLGYAYVAMGTNQDSIAEGQKLFASGKRVEWKLR